MQKAINFEKLYEEYYSKILNWVRSKTSDMRDAEDITSSVFEKALKGQDNFKWQGIPVSNWLYKIAKNTLIDFYRRKKDTITTDEILEIKGQTEDAEQYIISNLYFEQSIHALEPRERKIIYMKFFEGHANKSIAKKLGLTESNVATIIHRTIKTLKSGLKR